MLAFFNELSLPTFESDRAAHAFFKLLGKLCVKVKGLGITEVKVHSSFNNHEFAPGYFFFNWYSDGKLDSDLKQLILDMLTTMPYSDEILRQFELKEGKPLELAYEERVCIGLGLASNLAFDTAALSYPDQGAWDKESYPVSMRALEEGESDISTTDGIARNISGPAHCEIHRKFFQALLKQNLVSGRELWERRDELFPNLEFCERVKDQLAGQNGAMPEFAQIMKRLFELQEYAKNWDRKPIKPPDFQTKVSPESATRRKKFKEQLKIKCPDGVRRQFDWHARYTPGAGRIYFFPEEAGGRLIVGSIGWKLT
jgi:hypothetical protein